MENKYLREVVEKLRSRYRVYAIVLFGSRARGDWMPWSDYDLLVIADYRTSYLDRLREIIELLKNIPLPIEPHPYTLEESMELLRRGNPIVVDALEEGKVLYSTMEFEKLKKLYLELKRRGLRRTDVSIVLH